MPVLTYNIDATNLPKGAESCIVWALRQWTKDTEGRVYFYQSTGKPDIIFIGSEPPEGKSAWCYPLGNGVFSIVFDPALPWATTWMHRTFTSRPCLRKLALHEIGHALGLDHSDDPNSIMHPRPRFAQIDEASLHALPL